MLARVKRLVKNPFFKVVSDHTLYPNLGVSLSTCVSYSPAHKLDEDSWFKIERFSFQPFCIDLLRCNFDSKDYDTLKKEQFSKIAYICAIQDEDFYFQKVTPSLFFRKRFLAFGEIAEIEESSNRLVINEQPDAIYFKQSDTLVFRNLATIASIFKGINELYREATQQETENFLQSDFICLKDGYDANKVSKPNRKRIALALDTLKKMSEENKAEILTYINHYCAQKLKFDHPRGAVEISSDYELKLLLYGIEQRFYTTLVGDEKRLANSVIKID